MHLHSGLGGFYKIEKIRNFGTPFEYKELVVDWFQNLILDQGLDRIATQSDCTGYCQIGSGNGVPAAGNVALESFLAGVYSSSGNPGNSGSPNYYTYTDRYFTFGPGVGTGNISEIGVGWGTSGSTLFSRALIVDINQTPITITKLQDEYLYVTYQLRYYRSLVDSTGSVSFTGDLGGTYNWTMRAANANTTSGFSSGPSGGYPYSFNQGGSFTPFNGSIGIITSIPTGSASSGISCNCDNYIPGSYSLNTTGVWTPSLGNLSGGIKSILLTVFPISFQVEFDVAIPKTSNDQFSLTITKSWARI